MRCRTASFSVVLLAVIVVLVGSLALADHSGVPFPMGTFTEKQAPDVACPAGYDCTGFTVTCPGLSVPAAGVLATGKARVRLRLGLVMFFSGGEGDEWWSGDSRFALELLEELRSEGIEVIQVRWTTPWLQASEGEDAGPAHLACRPATVIRSVHDRAGLSLPPLLRACGFCVTGNSGGASQISYALSHYALEDILDVAVPTGGPPHAAIADGCLPRSGPMAYGASARFIDLSYGFRGGGPCESHAAAWTPRWTGESVDVGGDYYYGSTSVRFILGELDQTPAPAHARRYFQALSSANSPHVSLTVVPGMDHDIVWSPQGLAALKEALSSPTLLGLAQRR